MYNSSKRKKSSIFHKQVGQLYFKKATPCLPKFEYRKSFKGTISTKAIALKKRNLVIHANSTAIILYKLMA